MQVKMRYQKASLWGEFKFCSAYKIHCYLLMEKHPWLGYLTGASLYKYTSRGTLTGFSQVVKRGQKKNQVCSYAACPQLWGKQGVELVTNLCFVLPATCPYQKVLWPPLPKESPAKGDRERVEGRLGEKHMHVCLVQAIFQRRGLFVHGSVLSNFILMFSLRLRKQREVSVQLLFKGVVKIDRREVTTSPTRKRAQHQFTSSQMPGHSCSELLLQLAL